ncbi:hypothetical protein DFH09DRAFT_1090769 [Mycena vulgaris]|nr:hypothetical protein DFH09DRAFT_1090769 [Mycena vulgaris]
MATFKVSYTLPGRLQHSRLRNGVATSVTAFSRSLDCTSASSVEPSASHFYALPRLVPSIRIDLEILVAYKRLGASAAYASDSLVINGAALDSSVSENLETRNLFSSLTTFDEMIRMLVFGKGRPRPMRHVLLCVGKDMQKRKRICGNQARSGNQGPCDWSGPALSKNGHPYHFIKICEKGKKNARLKVFGNGYQYPLLSKAVGETAYQILNLRTARRLVTPSHTRDEAARHGSPATLGYTSARPLANTCSMGVLNVLEKSNLKRIFRAAILTWFIYLRLPAAVLKGMMIDRRTIDICKILSALPLAACVAQTMLHRLKQLFGFGNTSEQADNNPGQHSPGPPAPRGALPPVSPRTECRSTGLQAGCEDCSAVPLIPITAEKRKLKGDREEVDWSTGGRDGRMHEDMTNANDFSTASQVDDTADPTILLAALQNENIRVFCEEVSGIVLRSDQRVKLPWYQVQVNLHKPDLGKVHLCSTWLLLRASANLSWQRFTRGGLYRNTMNTIYSNAKVQENLQALTYPDFDGNGDAKTNYGGKVMTSNDAEQGL